MLRKRCLLVALLTYVSFNTASATDINTTCHKVIMTTIKVPPLQNLPICVINKSGVYQTITTSNLLGFENYDYTNPDPDKTQPVNLNNITLAPNQQVCRDEVIALACDGATFDLTVTDQGGYNLNVEVGTTQVFYGFNGWSISKYLKGTAKNITVEESESSENVLIYPY